MTNFIKKSGILPWQSEKINEAPSMPGVYVLRTSTEINSIVYVGSTDNLQRKLNEHFLSGDIPEIMFFDWYETSSIDEARVTEKEWVAKYSPKYNQES